MTVSTEAAAPRILIVDDQSSNVRLLEHTLRRAGYEGVMSTTDPFQVTVLHQQHRFHLILLDLQMPKMDGYEVMRKLQEIRTANPVTILVISAGSPDIPAALKSEGDGFIAKPFHLPDVVDRVRGMLQSPEILSMPVTTPLTL